MVMLPTTERNYGRTCTYFLLLLTYRCPST